MLVHVTLLLCDSAQVANGKLFVLGGGWTSLTKSQVGPVMLGLAILVIVPWAGTNQKHHLAAELVTEDGHPVGGDQPVAIFGDFEVGRPAGIKAGASLNVPFAFNLGLPLVAGAYRWDIKLDGSTEASASFEVILAPGFVDTDGDTLPS
jgi:hypothetical protein